MIYIFTQFSVLGASDSVSQGLGSFPPSSSEILPSKGWENEGSFCHLLRFGLPVLTGLIMRLLNYDGQDAFKISRNTIAGKVVRAPGRGPSRQRGKI